jgi:hypothetical protein
MCELVKRSDAEILPPQSIDAREELARHLYEEIESIYPGIEPEMLAWDELSEQQRIYFRSCVETLLDQSELVLSALTKDGNLPTTT